MCRRSAPTVRTSASASRSIRSSRSRSAGHDVPVARGGDRGLHRAGGRVRSGLQLRLHEHPELADADDAAADGDQPARRVRADVRRRRHRARSAGADAHRSQPAGFRRRRSASSSRRARRAAIARGSTSISATSARSSGASSRPSSRRTRCPTCRTRRSACPSRTRSTWR